MSPVLKSPLLSRRSILLGVTSGVALGVIGCRPSRSEATPTPESVPASPAPRQVGPDKTVPLTGAPNDGIGNALPAFLAAIREAEALGGATIEIPPGRFMLTIEGEGRTALSLPSGVSLRGSGRDASTLVMAPTSLGHVINAPFGNVTISDITVDGNAPADSPAAGHAIRMEGDNVAVLRARTLRSRNYGVALGERRFARNARLEDVEIIDSGNDGIDIKNSLGQSANIVIRDVTVDGFSLRRPDGGGAGVDLRGNCTVDRCQILQVPARNVGLRFRQGDTTTRHGPGAGGSTVRDLRVVGRERRPGLGISIRAGNVTLTNIDVSNVLEGVRLGASDILIDGGRIATIGDQFGVEGLKIAGGLTNNRIRRVAFSGPAIGIEDSLNGVVLEDCTFTQCAGERVAPRAQARGMRLERPVLDTTC